MFSYFVEEGVAVGDEESVRFGGVADVGGVGVGQGEGREVGGETVYFL